MGDERRCPRCGKEARETASFCVACGTDLRQEEGKGADEGHVRGGAGYAPLAPSPLPRPAEAGPLGAPAPGRRKRLAVAFGIAGTALIVAGAVVLALYLTLWRGGKGGVGDPLSLARRYMRAVEEKDVESYLDCFAEEGLSTQDNVILENLGLDPRDVLEMAFRFLDADFRDVALRLESESGDLASVVTTSGTLTVSLFAVKDERDLGREPLRFDMKREGGRWYLLEDPLPNPAVPEFFGDPGDWEMNLDDLGLPDSWKEFPGEEDLERLREWWQEMQERLEEEAPGDTAA